MTGPGRPRTGTPVLVRIPEELLQRIDGLAAATGVTRAEMIRQLLTAATDSR